MAQSPGQECAVRGAALLPLVAHLPSTLALVINDYIHEAEDYRALHDMCVVLEITARFLFIVQFTELRTRLGQSGQDLPEPLVRRLLQQFERPTLGSWRSLVDEVLKACAGASSCVPELPDYARSFVTRLGAARDDPFQKLLPMRNLLVHSRVTDATAAQLCQAHATAFERLVENLAFVRDDAGIALIASPGTGSLRLLVGLDGRDFDRAELPEEFRRSGTDRMLLLTPNGLLDLCPLHAYGEVFHVVDDKLEGRGEDAIHIYSRKGELGGVDYTALGSRASFSRGAPSWEERFAETFQLEAWRARFRAEGALARYMFQDRMDSLLKLFIGRDRQVTAARQRIDALGGGILWLTGKPGMGKSAFIASLVRDHLQPQDPTGSHSDRICIPYLFQAADGDRCRMAAFLEAAILRIAQGLGRTADVENDPRKRLEQFRAMLRQVAAEQPPRVRKVVIVLDGVNEIASVDPQFLDEIFALNMPGLVWVCAGQDDPALQSRFTRDRCQWFFERGSPFAALAVAREEDESYLPPLNADDVRAFFIEELGPRLPQFFGRDRRNDDGSRTNDYVEEVIRRSDGLPLYLHLLVRDLREGRADFAPGGERELPKDLQEYYERIIRRMGDDISQTLPAALALVAQSYEPLPAETLATLLADHELIGQPGGRALLEKALRLGGVPLRRAANADSALGYVPYHSSFRQHTQRSDSLTYSMSKARERLARLALNWQVLAPDSPPARYAFRFGPKHLADAGDWAGLGKLLQDDAFWWERKKALSVVDALLGTKEIAELLAKQGAATWTQLRDCAYRYCDLAETLRNEPQSLSDLVEAGKIDKARRVVDDDPDPIRRGAFTLALSTMLEQGGRSDEAAALWAEGSKLLGSGSGQGDDPLASYDPASRQIIRALLAKSSPAEPEWLAQLAKFPNRLSLAEKIPAPSAAGDGAPMPNIPFSFRIMGYFGPARCLVLALFFGLLFYLAFFVAAIVMPKGDVDAFIWRIVPLAAVGGVFLVFTFICGPCRRLFWIIMDRRFARLLAAFDAEIDRRQSAAQKRQLLLRLLRFLGKADLFGEGGRSMLDRRPWCEDLRRVIARHFRPEVFAEDASAAATAVTFSTAIGHTASKQTRLGAICFAPGEIEALEGELSRYPLLMLGNEPLLTLIVAVAARSRNPALLLHFMRINTELKLGDQDQYPRLLAELPPAVLAKAMLRSISGERQIGLQAAKSTAVDHVVRFIGIAADYKTMITFGRTEQMVLLGALAPPFALFQLFVRLIVYLSMFKLFALIINWFVLTGRVYDPFRLRRGPIQNARTWGQMQLDSELPSSSAPEARLRDFIVPQRLKTMILAQATLHGRLDEVLRGELATVDKRSRTSLARALSELARNSALLAAVDARRGSPGLAARIVLQTMGDRVLLRGMDTYRPPHGNAPLAAAPSGPIDQAREEVNENARDLAELEHVLPPASRWQSLAATTLLTLAGMSLWLGLLWRVPIAQFHAFLWPYGIGLSIGFALYCAAMQHVPRLTSVFGYKISDGRGLSTLRGGVALALMTYLTWTIVDRASDAGVPVAGYDYGSDWVSGLFVATPVVVANLIVPELIARWRGAGLYYPSAPRLWFHRAQWSAIAIAAVALLAWAMAYMASGPSHSYRRAIVAYDQAKALFDKGDYNGAVAALDQAIPLLDDATAHNNIKNPVNPTAYWMRCMALERLGKLEQAVADCTTVIERVPTASSFRARARLYDMLRQWTLAIADYREAIRQAPDQVGDYVGLAWCALMAGQPDAAIRASLSGLKMISDNAEEKALVNTNLAHGYLFARQFDMAWSIYRANKDAKVGPDKTFADAVIEDFNAFRAMGIVPADLEAELQKVKAYMKTPN